jgi:hypothetical protein
MSGGPFGAANTWTPVYGTFVCSVHHCTQLFPPDEEEHRDVQCHAADGDAAATSIGSVN